MRLQRDAVKHRAPEACRWKENKMIRAKQYITLLSVMSIFLVSISSICFSDAVAVLDTTSKTKLTLDMPSEWTIRQIGHTWKRPDLVNVVFTNNMGATAHIGYQGASVAPDTMSNSMNSIWNRDIPGKTPLAGITGPVFNCYYYSIPVNTNELWTMSGFATVEAQYFNMSCVYTNVQDLNSFIQLFRSARIEE
jgi:hypothetical protein